MAEKVYRELSRITIVQITTEAQVSQNSFYRNYADKEDILLKKRNLFHLFLNVFVEIYGAKREYDNMGAYAASFIA